MKLAYNRNNQCFSLYNISFPLHHITLENCAQYARDMHVTLNSFHLKSQFMCGKACIFCCVLFTGLVPVGLRKLHYISLDETIIFTPVKLLLVLCVSLQYLSFSIYQKLGVLDLWCSCGFLTRHDFTSCVSRRLTDI